MKARTSDATGSSRLSSHSRRSCRRRAEILSNNPMDTSADGTTNCSIRKNALRPANSGQEAPETVAFCSCYRIIRKNCI